MTPTVSSCHPEIQVLLSSKTFTLCFLSIASMTSSKSKAKVEKPYSFPKSTSWTIVKCLG